MKSVIYARVSSKEQEETGYSLPAQEKLAMDYASRKGFEVVKVFSVAESASGAKQRKVFADMMEYLQRQKVKVLLCEKVDRLTRNLKEAVVANDWIEEDKERQIHFVKQNLVIHVNARSDEKFRWDIEIVLAKKYIANLSEEVKKGQTAKLAAGHLPTRPPIGYRTTGEHGKKIHVVDESKAPLAQKMFEMYATGNYSVLQLTKVLNSMGLRGHKGAKLSKSRVHEYLSNPFFYGDICWNGELYKGVHEPLISLELFNEVQRKLDRKTVSPYFRMHEYRYKGKITCKECGRTVSWEKQKGKLYGACKNCKAQLGVKGKYILQDQLDTFIIEKIVEIAPKSPRVLKALQQALKEDAEDEITVYETKKQRITEAINRGDSRIDTAYTDRLDKRISVERYDELENEWKRERKTLTSDLERLGEDKSMYYEVGLSIHELAHKAREIYSNKKVTDEDRRLLLSYAFLNISVAEGKLTVEYTPSFEFLKKWVPPVNEGFELKKDGSAKGKASTFVPANPALLRDLDSNQEPTP